MLAIGCTHFTQIVDKFWWFFDFFKLTCNFLFWQKCNAQNGTTMECRLVGLIHLGFIHGSDTTRCTGLVATGPIARDQWRRLHKRAMNHRHLTQWLQLIDRYMRLEHGLFCLLQHKLLLWSKSEQACDWHANSSCRSIVHLSGERIVALCRGILSRTSLKCHI